MIENTFIVPVISENFLYAMLDSLQKYAGHEYSVILIDQRIEKTPLNVYADVVVQTNRNLGFAKAMNTGIALAKTKYVTYANDDILFLDTRWWEGIISTFEREPKIIAVNPLSPKEPAWGYGPNTPDWGIRVGDFIYPKGKDMQRPEDVDYDWLLYQYKKGWIDGIAGWCVVTDREKMERMFDIEKDINPDRLWFDERFYPGGGEDYDVCHRLYGAGFRAVATCSSYVWHHWGEGTKYVHAHNMIDDARRWNKLNELYKDAEDGWKSPIFSRPMKRVQTVQPVLF